MSGLGDRHQRQNLVDRLDLADLSESDQLEKSISLYLVARF